MSFYRCLTCGFQQDFEPTPEAVLTYHPWMVGKDPSACPACTQYIEQRGGRPEGVIEKPLLAVAGILESEDDPAVMEKFKEQMADWQEMEKPDLTTARKAELKKKHCKKARLFGFTAEEKLRITHEATELEPLYVEVAVLCALKDEAEKELANGLPALASNGQHLSEVNTELSEKKKVLEETKETLKASRPASLK